MAFVYEMAQVFVELIGAWRKLSNGELHIIYSC